MKRALVVPILLAAGCAAVYAQDVISAKSGTVHLVQGRVLMGDQPIQSKVGSFPEVKENATLTTEAGRAEVLLTPGVFLRVGEDSSFRMITNRLIDTRLELLTGKAVIEADEIAKDTAVTVVLKDGAIHLKKHGVYRFDASPAALHVFSGEALVEVGDRTVEVGEGRMLALDGQLAVQRFDKEQTDSLDNWSKTRAEHLSLANITAANSLRTRGNSWNSSGWAWNPYFGMFTFIPMNGTILSPYGYSFWSPGTIYSVYRPRPVWHQGSGGGFSGYGMGPGAHSSSGYSGAMASAPSASVSASHAPSTAASGASSAPVSHSGGASSGGGGGARR